MANNQAITYAQLVAAALTTKFANGWNGRELYMGGYSVDTRGQKFIRVVRLDQKGNSSSVEAFVDAEGNVYKPAGWKAPAKGVRYNVSTSRGLAELVFNADPFGGYLYQGRKQPLPECFVALDEPTTV